MPPRDTSEQPSLVSQLSLWTGELLRLRRERERASCALADLGVLPRTARPAVGPRDSLRVARLKEELTRLDRRRAEARAALDALDARVIDERTLELLLPGGPAAGSFLSWQPGEPEIAWWRAAPSLDAPRQPIADPTAPVVHPTVH